jgi:hypothetical protein
MEARSPDMSIVELSDDGALHVPAELLVSAKPHTKYQLDVYGDVIVLRPAGKDEPIWMNPDPEKRLKAFREYAESPRPPAPDIPLEFLDREHIY